MALRFEVRQPRLSLRQNILLPGSCQHRSFRIKCDPAYSAMVKHPKSCPQKPGQYHLKPGLHLQLRARVRVRPSTARLPPCSHTHVALSPAGHTPTSIVPRAP